LDQLLLTPNSRRRAGIEIADPEKNVLSPLELMMAMKHGEITREEYDRQKNLRNSAGV
jgi:predicted RNA-binding protein associated with RNAse of E/G family